METNISADRNPSLDFRIEVVNENSFRVYTLKSIPYRLPMKRHRQDIDWAAIKKQTVIAFARAYKEAQDILNISQLSRGPKRFGGLYVKLYKEGWFDEVFETPRQKTFILDREFVLPLCGANRVAWKKMKRQARKDFAKAYIKYFNIRTVKELQRGPYKIPGLQTRLLLDGDIAEVFGRTNKQTPTLGGNTVTVFIKNDKKTDWERMGEKLSLRYTRAYVREFGIKNSTDLARGPHQNQGMYRMLCAKGLLEKVFPYRKSKTDQINGEKYILPLLPSGNVNWQKVSDPDFFAYFLAVCAANNIQTRTAIKRFPHLVSQARKRNLLFQLLPDEMRDFERAGQTFNLPVKGKRVMWSAATPKTRSEFAAAHCLEHDLTHSNQLAHGPHKINGLYKVMVAKGELHAIFGASDRRNELMAGDLFTLKLKTNGAINWRNVSDEKILAYAEAYMRHYAIGARSELETKNPSLLMFLARRKLIRKLFPMTKETVKLCGRKFVLPKQGRYIQWRKIDSEILNIYAAALCHASGKYLRDLPCQLKKIINRATVNVYRKHLPTLDTNTARNLCAKYNVPNNYSLPDEILWAYGYEKKDDPRIRVKWIQKIDPPETPIA